MVEPLRIDDSMCPYKHGSVHPKSLFEKEIILGESHPLIQVRTELNQIALRRDGVIVVK